MNRIRTAAVREEAAAMAKESDRLKVARSLLGPKGGLPTLKGDLVKLAALLQTPLEEKDTDDQGQASATSGGPLPQGVLHSCRGFDRIFGELCRALRLDQVTDHGSGTPTFDFDLVRDYVAWVDPRSDSLAGGRRPFECYRLERAPDERDGPAVQGARRAPRGDADSGSAAHDAAADQLARSRAGPRDGRRLDPDTRHPSSRSSGQRQMISQAWERHRRDQLLISCSPCRVAEVMNAEHHGLYRKGVRETFVMEIPLLCSDVLGYNTSVGRCARTRGHTTGTALGPDAGWDFLVPAQRQAALKLLQKEKPYFVVMSVPSAPWMFSSVALSSRDRQRQLQQQLATQNRFATRVARLRLGGGRHFVIEHPPASALWRLPGVRSLAADPRCRQFSLDLGRFGTKTLGGERLRLAWTRLLTSSQAVVHEFGPVRCDGPPPRRPFVEIRAFPKGFTDRLVAAMEEEFDAETRFHRAAVQANECFEVSGVGASVDFVQETLAQEAGLEGESETEEETDPPFVGEITPAIRAAVRRVHEATGHRPPKRLARALLLSGAPPAAVQAARELKCDVKLPTMVRDMPMDPADSVSARPPADNGCCFAYRFPGRVP